MFRLQWTFFCIPNFIYAWFVAILWMFWTTSCKAKIMSLKWGCQTDFGKQINYENWNSIMFDAMLHSGGISECYGWGIYSNTWAANNHSKPCHSVPYHTRLAMLKSHLFTASARSSAMFHMMKIRENYLIRRDLVLLNALDSGIYIQSSFHYSSKLSRSSIQLQSHLFKVGYWICQLNIACSFRIHHSPSSQFFEHVR